MKFIGTAIEVCSYCNETHEVSTYQLADGEIPIKTCPKHPESDPMFSLLNAGSPERAVIVESGADLPGEDVEI